MKHPVLAVLAAMGLGACATTAGTTIRGDLAGIQGDLAGAKADLGRAVSAYGIAKGIADVAVAADPTLAAPVERTEGVIEPLIPKAQAMLAAADANALQVTQLVQEIQQQIVVMETATAQQVKVVANS